MRLTHIKLAGFKSFVDPTVIPVPAQLTGVVGPNGCGKSNVIDAVRWVLGESSGQAPARRIDAGRDLQRAPVGASRRRAPRWKLAFNNELGRAAGQWSQYAEISVKRVLDRSGDSSYYINNMRVRRRDVADLFLGTGVGARAYAIIEQAHDFAPDRSQAGRTARLSRRSRGRLQIQGTPQGNRIKTQGRARQHESRRGHPARTQEPG